MMRRKKNNYDQVIAGVVLFFLSIGVIAGSEKLRREVRAASGTLVEIADTNAELYQVTDLYVKKDGSYVVHGTAKGFKSDIKAAVTFDKTGNQILDLEIVSQDETPDIGSKVTQDEFLSEFSDIKAPIKVADLDIVSPNAENNKSINNSDSADGEKKPYDSSEWNMGDTSVEAQAVRKLYDTGLLESATKGEELSTAFVDLSPEEKATAELEKANLLDGSNEDNGMSENVEATNVDAITGATISSKTVATIVNNAYYFLEENIIE